MLLGGRRRNDRRLRHACGDRGPQGRRWDTRTHAPRRARHCVPGGTQSGNTGRQSCPCGPGGRLDQYHAGTRRRVPCQRAKRSARDRECRLDARRLHDHARCRRNPHWRALSAAFAHRALELLQVQSQAGRVRRGNRGVYRRCAVRRVSCIDRRDRWSAAFDRQCPGSRRQPRSLLAAPVPGRGRTGRRKLRIPGTSRGARSCRRDRSRTWQESEMTDTFIQPIELTLNRAKVSSVVEPRTNLADFLREQQMLCGTNIGCEQGVCGACTLLVDGVPTRSCITPAIACAGSDVQSIEGFDNDATMNELRAAFSAEHALQCGYCTPGMLVTARDIVTRLPDADDARVRLELSGNLCRCTGYVGIVRAIRRVLDARRALAAEPVGTPLLAVTA